MRSAIAAIPFLLLLVGCGRDIPTGSTPQKPPLEFTYTCDDSLEAKLLALWWSGNAVPPERLMNEFLYDLGYIRYLYGNSLPEVDTLRFMPYWVPSRIVVQFDGATGRQVEEGSYTGWNELEPHFRPSHVSAPFLGSFFALGFSDVLHSARLAQMYAGLPGVLSSDPDAYGCRDLCPFPMYPAPHGEFWTYLFEYNREGIRAIRYIYFRCGDRTPVFAGTWSPFRHEPRPDWWEEASANFSEFYRD